MGTFVILRLLVITFKQQLMIMQLRLPGRTFGRLTVISLSHIDKKRYYYNCKCRCGNTITVVANSLARGDTKSCGCYQKEITSARSFKHGLTHSRLHSIWTGIKTRCYNLKAKDYHNYGKRGITMCAEWKNDFMNFFKWAQENGYDNELQIDRKENSIGYNPENCRWVTCKTNNNNRENNHRITYNGETKTLTEWSEMLNIPRHKLSARLRRNWTIERIFTT